MRAVAALFVVGIVVGACTASEESAATIDAAPSFQSTPAPEGAPMDACHPTNDREDCTLAIVLLDEPIDLAAAEAFAAEHDAYLNVLYRVDPVCVAKDFPIMGGPDLGETPSRRTYWEADQRMDRIAEDIGAGLVPPPTIGGFDVVIDRRMSEEWRFAQMSGVLFDNFGLWVDAAGAAALAAEYSVDFPDHWRYEHSEGRGEIALSRDYEPPSLATRGEVDECIAIP